MPKILEGLIARSWNALVSPTTPRQREGLVLGREVRDGQVTERVAYLPHPRRAEHLILLGRTGTGKSSLLRAFAAQDIRAKRGFLFFDHHGDTTPFLLKLIAHEEKRTGQDLSPKLIVVEPGHPEYSVGLNVLEPHADQDRFVQIAEFAA